MRHVIAWLLLLTVVSPTWLRAQDPFPTIDEFDKWLVGRLATLSDQSVPIDRRIAARDEVVRFAGPDAPSAQRLDRAEKVRARIGPLIRSEDRVTALGGIYIAARMRHAFLVPVLQDSLGSAEPMVRYWAAKGLAEARTDMIRLGGAGFFNNPIRALAVQAAKEDSHLVAREIYAALALGDLPRGDAGKPIDPLKISFIFDRFMDAFRSRIRLLDQGKIDSLLAEVDALKLSGEWFQYYRRQRPFAAAILVEQALLLKWAAQYYDVRFDELTEQRKGHLEQVVLRGAEVIGSELNAADPGFAARVRQDLLGRHDRKRMLLTVMTYVGGPGMAKTGGWRLRDEGVTDELPDLKDWAKAVAPATQPDTPTPDAT